MRLRRLYSTFAGGWPGLGLLLLRLVAGSALVVRAGSILRGDLPINTLASSAFLAAAGVLLISGLWTPIAGTLAASIQTWQLLTPGGELWPPLLLGTIAGALAMLGPGLWSVDARLFGWKRVEALPRKTPANSR